MQIYHLNEKNECINLFAVGINHQTCTQALQN